MWKFMKPVILVVLLVCVPTGAMGQLSADMFKDEVMEDLGRITYCMGFLEASEWWITMVHGVEKPQLVRFSAKTLCSHMQTLYRTEKLKDKHAVEVAVKALAELMGMTTGELFNLFSNKSCEKP